MDISNSLGCGSKRIRPICIAPSLNIGILKNVSKILYMSSKEYEIFYHQLRFAFNYNLITYET